MNVPEYIQNSEMMIQKIERERFYYQASVIYEADNIIG